MRNMKTDDVMRVAERIEEIARELQETDVGQDQIRALRRIADIMRRAVELCGKTEAAVADLYAEVVPESAEPVFGTSYFGNLQRYKDLMPIRREG